MHLVESARPARRGRSCGPPARAQRVGPPAGGVHLVAGGHVATGTSCPPASCGRRRRRCTSRRRARTALPREVEDGRRPARGLVVRRRSRRFSVSRRARRRPCRGSCGRGVEGALELAQRLRTPPGRTACAFQSSGRRPSPCSPLIAPPNSAHQVARPRARSRACCRLPLGVFTLRTAGCAGSRRRRGRSRRPRCRAGDRWRSMAATYSGRCSTAPPCPRRRRPAWRRRPRPSAGPSPALRTFQKSSCRFGIVGAAASPLGIGPSCVDATPARRAVAQFLLARRRSTRGQDRFRVALDEVKLAGVFRVAARGSSMSMRSIISTADGPVSRIRRRSQRRRGRRTQQHQPRHAGRRDQVDVAPAWWPASPRSRRSAGPG